MQTSPRQTLQWSTSAFGEMPSPTPAELAELSTHVKECRRARGRFFLLRSEVKAMNEIIANRVWTTMAAIAVLLLLASLAWAA